MSWSRALGEFGATVISPAASQGQTQTLPLVVYAGFGGGDLDASVAAAAVLILAASGVLVSVHVLHWKPRTRCPQQLAPGQGTSIRTA